MQTDRLCTWIDNTIFVICKIVNVYLNDGDY